MRFFEPLVLETYIYTDEQLELKRIDDNFDVEIKYDDPVEERDFYVIDSAWKAKEGPAITNIQSSGQCFVVRHSLEEIRKMIKQRMIIPLGNIL